jgi:hypothetical protein
MKRLARLLRCTEGHAYTGVIVGVLATVLIAFGIPPMLRDDPAAPAVTVSTTTTTIAIPRFGETPPGEAPAAETR